MILQPQFVMPAKASAELSLYFEDDFNRSDSSTLGSDYYSADYGNIVSNRVEVGNNEGNNGLEGPICTTPLPTNEVIIEINVTSVFNDYSYIAPLLYNSTRTSQYHARQRGRGSDSSIYLVDNNSVSDQSANTGLGTDVTPFTLKLHYYDGGTLDFYRDDALLVSHTFSSPITLGSVCYAGFSGHNVAAWAIGDNFKVWAR